MAKGRAVLKGAGRYLTFEKEDNLESPQQIDKSVNYVLISAVAAKARLPS